MVLTVVLGLLWALPALAQEPGDSVTVTKPGAEIGEQVTLVLEVVTPAGATVELDPAAPSWGGVEVVRIASQEQQPEGENIRHILRVVVAGFAVGELQFQPAVNIIQGVDSVPRDLPPVSLEVVSVLPPDAPLELSPLPPPSAISGAESPFLRPAIALGAVVGVVLLAGVAWIAIGRILRRPRGILQPSDVPAEHPGLATATALLHTDSVAAYRALASVVRRKLGERYGFPAFALTSRELETRMEAVGVDRWEARLVGGLLENCDAVVYAGYRPAPERREADLNMAREIVEPPADDTTEEGES